MATNKNRLARLEKQGGAVKGKKYLCVIGLGFWDTPEEQAKGFKVQCCTIEAGGTGGEPFYLKTRKELDEFAARVDVDLDTVEINFQSASGEIEDGKG